jgi:hypothetical protein
VGIGSLLLRFLSPFWLMRVLSAECRNFVFLTQRYAEVYAEGAEGLGG